MPKPLWLKTEIRGSDNFFNVKKILRFNKVHTICEEARCPNRGKCWNDSTATFLILGDSCTRNCLFCSVKTGNMTTPDEDEPLNIAKAAEELKLKYVVITSVTRDDLADRGAGHFKNTINRIKELNPLIKVEILIPDYIGNELDIIVESKPDVIAHNIEVVERLTSALRDHRFSYKKSINVLYEIKKIFPQALTKSSILLGLGENRVDIENSMNDLLNAGVDILVLGQYLQPTKKCYSVVEYITPDFFNELMILGKNKGFKYVVAGPLVRTSYDAAKVYEKITNFH